MDDIYIKHKHKMMMLHLIFKFESNPELCIMGNNVVYIS